MQVFIKGRRHITDAKGEYNEKTGELVLYKGSTVSEEVVDFKNRESVLKKREGLIDKNYVVKKDIVFLSASAAAEFVCGYSVNGLNAWHVEKHKYLKDVLK